jgi:hypothetical protein
MTNVAAEVDSLEAVYRSSFVRFEVFTEVTLKNGVFWDVTLCGSC